MKHIKVVLAALPLASGCQSLPFECRMVDPKPEELTHGQTQKVRQEKVEANFRQDGIENTS